MRTRPRCIPLEEAIPGMTLSAPAVVSQQGVVRFALPEGHLLTEDNLHQLAAHQAEYLFIAAPDVRSDEQIAEDAALAARRTLEIFAGADLSDSHMAALFDKVLAYRSA